jgi:ribosome-binding ATPase YchF (GTP1/OBG family)
MRKAVLACPVPTIPLLSAKNFMIIANISEEDINAPEQNKYVQQVIKHFGADRVVPICVRTELELSQLQDAEKQDFMDMLGIKESALQTVIEKSFKNLGMITFFTCGPNEIHAWPIQQGITIRASAGEIHSDLEKGFICAEVFNYQDIVNMPLKALKDAGKIRTEGKDYITQDGDIILVKFNV